jgi:hypothetical protein
MSHPGVDPSGVTSELTSKIRFGVIHLDYDPMSLSENSILGQIPNAEISATQLSLKGYLSPRRAV